MANYLVRDNWSYDDYLAFLLVYAANADFIVEDEESLALMQKLGEEQYAKMKDYFLQLNDIQSIEVIYEFREKYCREPEQVTQVLSEIKTLMEQDEEFQPEEEELYLGIKRILTGKRKS